MHLRLLSSQCIPVLQPAAGACPPTPPRVVLVCGADVLHSMADPTLWRQDLLEVRGLLVRPAATTVELLCSMLLASLLAPSAYRVCAERIAAISDHALPCAELPQTLLRNHGVVCISRTGSDTARLLDKPGTLLNTYRCSVAQHIQV